jgi:hypothetical protein
MTKPIPEVVVSLKDIYKTYSEQLIFSDKVSELLLDSSDIPASGNEIEMSFRKILSDLLPSRVNVGHGHLVDKELKLSYQQDVIISEGQFSKSLIKSLDGTEIFPYESIFACGEIKRRWSQKKLEQNIISIKRNKEELLRLKISPDVIDSGVRFVKASSPITNNSYRNPLFSFSFAIDYDPTISLKAVSKILSESSQNLVPNVVAILKVGIFVKVNSAKLDKGDLQITLYPEFKESDPDINWVLLRLEPEVTLAYLVFLISQHLNETVLEKASYLDYLNKMFGIGLPNIDFL